MLHSIKNNLAIFSKAERKVAEVILADPQTALHANIADLAKKANVSEPTVNRFCRRLDTKGFPDFKLLLAQSLAIGTNFITRHVDPSDNVFDFCEKIFDSTIAELAKAKQRLKPQQIESAIQYLLSARRISFFGLGSSATVCRDALNKFLRFNVPVQYFEDLILQKISCINCLHGDVFVFISYTGKTKELVEAAELAQINNGITIGITAPNSPLAKACSLCIELEATEETDIYMPMVSRSIQMTIIDVLAIGYSLKSNPDTLAHLNQVKDVIETTRF